MVMVVVCSADGGGGKGKPNPARNEFYTSDLAFNKQVSE